MKIVIVLLHYYFHDMLSWEFEGGVGEGASR